MRYRFFPTLVALILAVAARSAAAGDALAHLRDRGTLRWGGDIQGGEPYVFQDPHDSSQLVGFEDAAANIGATSEISISKFSKGRATLSMRLDEPVELLRELEQRSPLEFRVRRTDEDRVILDLDDEAEAA